MYVLTYHIDSYLYQAFLVLTSEEFPIQLSSQYCGEVSAVSSTSAILATCLPCNLTINESKLAFWDAVFKHRSAKLRYVAYE